MNLLRTNFTGLTSFLDLSIIFDDSHDRAARKHAFGKLLGLTLILSSLYFFFSPILSAKFGFWGEHELMDLNTPYHYLPLQKLISLVSKFSLGQKLYHFCPLHQLTLYFECFLLGENASAWHAFRLIEAMLCATLIYYSLLRFLSPALAIFCTLFLFIGESGENWIFLTSEDSHGFLFMAIGTALFLKAYFSNTARPTMLLHSFLVMVLSGYNAEAYSFIFPSLLFILLIVEKIYPLKAKPVSHLWKASPLYCLLILALSGLSVYGVMHARYSYPVPPTYRQLFHYRGSEVFWVTRIANLAPVLILVSQALVFEKFSPSSKKLLLFTSAILICGILPQWLYYGDYLLFLEIYLTPISFFILASWVVAFCYFIEKDSSTIISFKVILLCLCMVELAWGVELHRRFNLKASETLQTHQLVTAAVVEHSQHRKLPFLICADFDQIELVKQIRNGLSLELGYPIKPYVQLNKEGIENAHPSAKFQAKELEDEINTNPLLYSKTSPTLDNPNCCVTLRVSHTSPICHEQAIQLSMP